MNFLNIILLQNCCRISFNLPSFLSKFFNLFPKTQDRRKRTNRRNLKPTKPYAKWKQDILKTYDYKCAKCGVKGKRLAIHHIRSFGDNPDLRLDSDNGAPLCLEHHKEFHEIYGFQDFTSENFFEYIEK